MSKRRNERKKTETFIPSAAVQEPVNAGQTGDRQTDGWTDSRVDRQTGGQVTDSWMEVSLCEDEAGLAVNLEDLLDGVDVRRRPKVQTQVVLVSCSHDLPGRALHGEGQT